MGYVSHTDPHGKIPVWLMNKVTQIFAPKVKYFFIIINHSIINNLFKLKQMVKKLHKAALGYLDWKVQNNPNYKPWHFPEQITAPRIRIEDVSL